LQHGGEASRESYANIYGARRDRHIDFFNRMRPYYEEEVDGKRRLFIQAGFSSMHGPIREHHFDNFFWDRTLWEMAMAVDGRVDSNDPVYPKRLRLFHTIYIGHTPTTNYDIEIPMQRCNIWNVDTGAAFLGRIAVMDIETKLFWQSDPVQSLYPHEKGRNK
jgi:serine/threonine protein phosphatase 1